MREEQIQAQGDRMRVQDELISEYGGVIEQVTRIGRKEKELHYLYEDSDFSAYRVKKLMREGEKMPKG